MDIFNSFNSTDTSKINGNYFTWAPTCILHLVYFILYTKP